MRDIIERMITTRCGLALVVETRNAENIGDKATVKKRNGTGIDESNVIISIYFFIFFRKIFRLYYERKVIYYDKFETGRNRKSINSIG